MAEETVKPAKTKISEPTFGIENLVKSKKYRYLKDVLRVVLEKDALYTLQEVDDKIEAFMKGGK